MVGRRGRGARVDLLREYVLVAQDRRRLEVWRRDGGTWVHSIYEAGVKVPLRSISVERGWCPARLTAEAADETRA